MRKWHKRYKACREGADLSESFSLEKAVEVLAQMPCARFDETVEIVARLGVDPRQSEQMVRGQVDLPHGSGKKITLLIFTEHPQEAREAGADFAGLQELIEKIQGGWLGFDVALATPTAMKEVRKISRILGPRGLMPNPKSGTVTNNIKKAIQEIQSGRIEFKMDKNANVHTPIGKRSFKETQLIENATALIEALIKANPESFKGRYIKSLSLCATMTPGIRIDSEALNKRQ